jgi:hypothetical protein
MEKHIIQIKQKMATIAWNPHGFHVIDDFPKDKVLNPLTTSNIFYSQSLNIVQSWGCASLLFMQTMPDRI